MEVAGSATSHLKTSGCLWFSKKIAPLLQFFSVNLLRTEINKLASKYQNGWLRLFVSAQLTTVNVFILEFVGLILLSYYINK